jgi:hypothetical protein
VVSFPPVSPPRPYTLPSPHPYATLKIRAINYCYRQPNNLAIVAMATEGLVEESFELLQFKIKK